MTYPEYLQAKEYRDRLLNLVEIGRRKLPPKGFKSFASSMLGKVDQLNRDMLNYEKSTSAAICSFVGLATFNISAQVGKSEPKSEPTLRWNSPAPEPKCVPKFLPSQQNLIPDDDDVTLLRPCPV
jgi:hypothetical protein